MSIEEAKSETTLEGESLELTIGLNMHGREIQIGVCKNVLILCDRFNL